MEETKDPYIGLTLEGALLERKLGQGGMGAVYLARHLVLEKYIAIKILTPDLLRHPQSLERFLREAKTAAQLEHPNIIQVYHVGVQHSIHFLSMQYVPGQSLQKHLHQRGKIPLAPALTVIQKILEGLAFAHHCGVIHRDIKPDNIMITPQGQVKIVDFGLARSCQAGNTLSQTGQIMGTPYFMSPEQCNGETVDLRSDIYSLGITFYYLLSAQYPYDGQSAISILMQHSNPQPAKNLNDLPHLEVPPEICAIIRRMMEKNKTERYPNLNEVLKDFAPIFARYPQEFLCSEDHPFSPPSSTLLNAPTSAWASSTSPTSLIPVLSSSVQKVSSSSNALLNPPTATRRSSTSPTSLIPLPPALKQAPEKDNKKTQKLLGAGMLLVLIFFIIGLQLFFLKTPAETQPLNPLPSENTQETSPEETSPEEIPLGREGKVLDRLQNVGMLLEGIENELKESTPQITEEEFKSLLEFTCLLQEKLRKGMALLLVRQHVPQLLQLYALSLYLKEKELPQIDPHLIESFKKEFAEIERLLKKKYPAIRSILLGKRR